MKVILAFCLVSLFVVSTLTYAQPCDVPDKSIESFLVRFAKDKSFQRNRVRYPLQITYMPPGTEKWVTEHWSRVQLDKIEWPLFLSRNELIQWKYTQTMKEHSSTKVTIRHDSGGDAYVRIFDFQYLDGCWSLISLADYSL